MDFFFLFPHGKLLISMAVKYSFIALLKCVLMKLNLGYKVFILQRVVGGMLSQDVSDMGSSSVGNIFLVLIF